MLIQLGCAVLLLAIVQSANGQAILPGKCPNVSVMKEFDLAAYTGIWYQYAEYPTVWETGYKCIYAKYRDLGDNTVSVYNSEISKLSGTPYIISGYAKVLAPATLAVVFFEGQSETEPNYEVIGTDYTNYAVVYSCRKYPFTHAEFLWVLTRERKPSEETILAAKKVIADNGLSQALLVKTDHEDCPRAI